MSNKKELIKNTLIIAFGRISTQLITFLLLPLYTAYLTTSDFGTVDLIITYIALLAPVLTIQLEMAAFRFLIDMRNDNDGKTKVISNVIEVTGLILLIFTILYLLLDRFIQLPYSHLVLLCIGATIFSNLFLQIARGLGRNTAFAIGSIIAGITSIILNIILLVGFHMGATGMLIAIVVANVACSSYLFLSLRLYRNIKLQSVDSKLRSRLLKYSFPLVPNGISWWLINAADRTIISLILGLSANGIFAIAYKFPIIFSSLFSFFSMSWTESASVHIDDRDRDKFFSDTNNASLRLFGSLGLIIIAYIPLVFSLLIDKKYHESYMYIPILMVGAFFSSIVGFYSAIYVAKKMTKQVASTSIFAALINIALTLALIRLIGLYAAAIASTIAYLAMAVYRHYDVKKYVTITYEKNIFLKLTIAYTLTMALYYYNNFFGNITNAIIITIIVILFNKTMIKVIKDKVFEVGSRRRRQPLTSEQEVQGEIL